MASNVRKRTAAEWAAANPILRAGLIAVSRDTGDVRVGNGIDQWADLGSSGGGGASEPAVATTTVAALADTTLSVGALVLTGGFYAMGDGGGGLWKVEAASGETWVASGHGHSLDAAGHLQATSSKRLTYVDNGPVRAAAFGLKASATNTLLLQAVCTYAASVKRGVDLPGGSFTSGEVVLVSGQKIRGTGDTILTVDSSATRSIFYAFDAYKIEIEGITFAGTLAATAGTAKARTTTLGAASGVMLNETDTVVVRNCHFINFGYSGLRIYHSGGSGASTNFRIIGLGNKVENCHFHNNFWGLYLDGTGEYAQVSNCSGADNRYGAYDKGGNALFTGCNFSSNQFGLHLEEDSNSGHGSAVGCQFNHNATAVYVNGITLGFVFAGCQFFAGNIDLIVATGIIFSACEFGNTMALRFQGGGKNQFANCHVVGAAVTVTHSYNAVADATVLTNVFKGDGTAVV